MFSWRDWIFSATEDFHHPFAIALHWISAGSEWSSTDSHWYLGLVLDLIILTFRSLPCLNFSYENPSENLLNILSLIRRFIGLSQRECIGVEGYLPLPTLKFLTVNKTHHFVIERIQLLASSPNISLLVVPLASQARILIRAYTNEIWVPVDMVGKGQIQSMRVTLDKNWAH